VRRCFVALTVSVATLGAPAGLASRAHANGEGRAPSPADFTTAVTAEALSRSRTATHRRSTTPTCHWQEATALQIEAIARSQGAAGPVVSEGAEAGIDVEICSDGWAGQWRWTPAAQRPVVTAKQLADRAVVVLEGRLPAPAVGSSPPAGVTAIVKLPVVVWVQRSQWAPLRFSVSDPASGLAATAVAVPVTMSFDAGDGSGGIPCVGPGAAVAAGADLTAAAKQAGVCSHVYQRITRAVDGSPVAGRPAAWQGSVRVVWRVSWSATNGQAGVFAPVSKTTAVARAVTEIQTVNVAG
jgi:hypothetical protein